MLSTWYRLSCTVRIVVKIRKAVWSNTHILLADYHRRFGKRWKVFFSFAYLQLNIRLERPHLCLIDGYNIVVKLYRKRDTFEQMLWPHRYCQDCRYRYWRYDCWCFDHSRANVWFIFSAWAFRNQPLLRTAQLFGTIEKNAMPTIRIIL